MRFVTEITTGLGVETNVLFAHVAAVVASNRLAPAMVKA